MSAAVAEELAHGAARVRGEVLERGGVRRRRAHDDRVLHRVGIRQALDDLRDRRPLLADRHVDAVELRLLVGRLVERPLVDDRVDGHRRLAGDGREGRH